MPEGMGQTSNCGGGSMPLEHLGPFYLESLVRLAFFCCLFRLWFLFLHKKINLELYLLPVHGADRRRVCSGGGVWGEG